MSELQYKVLRDMPELKETYAQCIRKKGIGALVSL